MLARFLPVDEDDSIHGLKRGQYMKGDLTDNIVASFFNNDASPFIMNSQKLSSAFASWLKFEAVTMIHSVTHAPYRKQSKEAETVF